jgi:hypothetical protein
VHPPGTVANSGRELDVPLSWLFVSEDPAPTGSAPNAIVGATLPCGYRAVYGTVSSPDASPLRVRVHALFDGAGDPHDARCRSLPLSVQMVSLQRLRLADFTVTDASPHAAGDPPVPTAALHVVADDNATPAAMRRRFRRCTPGDDSTCTAGGVCATPSGRNVGVCVPPYDPYLAVEHPCPEGRAEAVLGHAPMSGPAVPADGAIHACLAGCDDTHPCDAAFECVPIGTHAVCLPR